MRSKQYLVERLSTLVRTLAPADRAPGDERAVTRLSGPDRLVTGVEIARHTYRDGTAEAAVLARADSFADALAGAPLAAHVDGPLLLTGGQSLDPKAAAELRRVLGTANPSLKPPVYLLGTTAQISTAVEQAITQLGYQVQRITPELIAATRHLTELFAQAVMVRCSTEWGSEPLDPVGRDLQAAAVDLVREIRRANGVSP